MMKSSRHLLVVALVVAAGIAGGLSGADRQVNAQPGGAFEITRVCVSFVTGSIRNAPGTTACGANERAVELPDGGPLFACASGTTGLLRVAPGPNQCQTSEISLDLAEIDVVQVCVSRYTNRLRYAGPNGSCTRSEYGAVVLPENVPSVYVADSGANVVKQFTLDGQFIRQWGSPGSEPGQFSDLFRLTVGPDGFVYATDAINCRVQKFTYYGSFVTEWGECGEGPGQFQLPSGIEVDSQNSVFVTDLFGARVQKFSAAGQYITEWGDGGTDPGQFLLPLDLAVDSADNVFVSDPFFNNRVQEFDNNGSYIDFWSISEGPAGIDIDTTSDLAYVTTGEDTVVKIDATDGAVITQWGATGTGEGQFDEPQGIVVASNGLIYVTDRANDRVQYFDSDGTFLGQWGTPTAFDEIIGIAATAGGEGTGNR